MTGCAVSGFRNHPMYPHPEIHFVLGQSHPSTERPKNLLVHHRPEATSSVYRTMYSDVWTLVPTHFRALTRRSRSPLRAETTFRSDRLFYCRFYAIMIHSPVFFLFPTLCLHCVQYDERRL